MKVLLINSPTTFEQMYGDWDLSALDTYTPPLGIMHIASYILEHDHEASIMDLQSINWDLEKVIEFIISKNPDIVGLSAMTINCMNAQSISEELRRNGFTSSIVMGGAHITAAPIETLSKFNAIDYGVVGEGETTFLELIEKLGNDQTVEDVKGIAWRDKEGHIKINPHRPFIEDLDKLPFPAWDLLENFPENYPSSLLESKRLPAAGIMTSRGCPFHCTFCDNRVFGTKVRHFSASYTLRMIKHLIDNYGIKDLMILDDNFLINKKKLFAICDSIIEEKLALTWYCIAHIKTMTEDRLKKIKEAGCWFVEVGIESGNNDILKRIRKNTDKSEIASAVRRAKKEGLVIKGNFIFGFPDDTKETVEESIQFAMDIDIDFFQQNFLTVWPGCEIAKEVFIGEGNISNSALDWDQLAHQKTTYVPPGMTKEQLIHLSKKAFRKFYLRPKIILRLLPLLMTPRGIKFFLTAFRVFLQTIFRKK